MFLAENGNRKKWALMFNVMCLSCEVCVIVIDKNKNCGDNSKINVYNAIRKTDTEM